jgi:serine/threonine-protein kinase PknK
VTDVDDFVETIERVAGGGSVVDPALVQELLGARQRDDPLAQLTPREREVLELMAEGLDPRSIARLLGISLHTSRGHVKSLLAKLQAHSQLEAVVNARRAGILRVR